MNWRRLLLLGFLAGFAWLTTSTGAPEPGPVPLHLENDLFEVAALEARVARVRPVVEEIVGASLGPPVPLIVADSEEYGAHAASHGVERLPETDPPEDRTMKWSLMRSAAESTSPQAAVFCGSDGVWLVPERIHQANGTNTESVLDVLLSHELTHVHQDRQLGFEGYVRQAPDKESQLARRAVVEGHAQWVARRVAAKLGLDDAFAVLFEGMARIDGTLGDAPHRALLIEEQVETRFVYGHGEVFFDAVVSRLGYEAALERLRAAPPATLYEVLHPNDWLQPESTPRTHVDLPRLLGLSFELAEGGSEGVLHPMLAFELSGSELGEAASAGVLRARRRNLVGRAALHQGLSGTVQVATCASPEAARTLLRAMVESAESGANVWNVLGGHHAVGDASLETWEQGDMHGVRGRVTLRASLKPASEATFVAIRRDATVVSLLFDDAVDRRMGVARLARRLWALSTAEQPLAHVLAAARTGRWMERLAAAASLGLREDAAGEIHKALAGLLTDEDADVRLVALHALQARNKTHPVEESAVQRALLDPDADVRLHAISVAGRVDDARAATTALAKALASPDPSARIVAARASAPWIQKDDGIESVLTKALDDADPRVRLAALHAWVQREDERPPADDVLQRLGRDPAAEVRALLMSGLRLWDGDRETRKQLVFAGARDESARVRYAAWFTMGRGPVDPDGDVLEQGLRDAEAGIRDLALTSIPIDAMVGASYDEHVDAIRAALRDPHPQVRLAAVFAISYMKQGRWRYTPALVSMLDTPWLRPAAVRALGHETTNSHQTVDALCRLIRERQCRATVAEALEEIGSPARRAVPLLRTLLKVEHVLTRLAAAKALRGLSEPGEPLVDVVLPALQDPDFIHRIEAIKAIAVVSRPNLARIRRQRRHSSAEVRAEARRAWKGRDTREPRIVAQLQRLLADPVPEVRTQAVETLEKIDPKNPVSLKAVARLFEDPVPFVREAVASAFDYSRGDLDALRPMIREMVKTGDAAERVEAALFLAEGEDTSPVLVPALVHALANSESWERDDAAEALARIVPRADDAIEPLKNALGDSEASVRGAAAAALLAMEPVARTTFDAVTEAFRKERERSARRPYYDALVSCAAHASPVVPYLVEVLDGQDQWELRRASDLLGAIGPGAKAAVPALRQLREHRNVHVAEAAEKALVAIGSP